MTHKRQKAVPTHTDLMERPLDRVLGKATARKLKKLGITTPRELLYHFPRRYDKWGDLTPMSHLFVGADITVMARVADTEMRRTFGGKWQLKVTITDGTQVMDVVFWAKHSGMLRGHQARLTVGETFYFAGKVGSYRNRLQLTYPDYDAADSPARNIHQPIAIYPTTKGLSSWVLAKAIDTVLLPLTPADIDDPIPADVRMRYDLPDIVSAFHMIHHPETDDDHGRAYRRFQFEEALVLQTILMQRRHMADSLDAPICQPDDPHLSTHIIEHLPFELTDGQHKAIAAIGEKLMRPTPSNILLQGDVGAGKTIVALLSMARAVDSGYQAALLAPTSVLAAQHFESLSALMGDYASYVHLLTAATPTQQRNDLQQRLDGGEPLIVVGTHALLADRVSLPKLGVVIVDEQHRFGVAQRDILRHKGDVTPHTVVMTATPIPRTVAMTVFGDMDTIVLDQLPSGRSRVETFIVQNSRRSWVKRMWERAREEIDNGGRVFVVCARVEEKDEGATSIEKMIDVLPTLPPMRDIAVSVVTGKMKAEEKQQSMQAFISGRTPLLLATTVIEVGVDVPDATMMIILDADFFGLSQLHQLRGRVGRGTKPAICMAATNAEPGSIAMERLDAFASTTNGFDLAEKDLELRREGNILGSQQSGTRSALRTLSLADTNTVSIIRNARDEADTIVTADPSLDDHVALRAATERIDSEEEEFLERG